MDLNLKEQVVVITGAASGIGRAAALAFAEEGAHVSLWDISDTAGAVAAEMHERFKTQAAALHVDISDERSVTEALAETRSKLGQIDHLIHAAAIGSGKFGFPFTNVAPSDWKRVLDVNVMGMVHIAHALAPAMIGRKRGTLTFISSVAGQIGSQTDPPYSASKAANINFAQCLARDLAPHGIRVNTVCPGMVKTPLNRAVWQAWHDRQPPESRQSYQQWADAKVRALVPLGTWQTPEDVASLLLFLASDRAAQITGQTMNVDGGYVMHW